MQTDLQNFGESLAFPVFGAIDFAEIANFAERNPQFLAVGSDRKVSVTAIRVMEALRVPPSAISFKIMDKGSKRKAVEGRGASSLPVPGRGLGSADKRKAPPPSKKSSKKQRQQQKPKGKAGGGRQPSWVRAQFTEVHGSDAEEGSGDEASGSPAFSCNHCDKVLTGNITRMRDHLLNLGACHKFLRSEQAKELAPKHEIVRDALNEYLEHSRKAGTKQATVFIYFNSRVMNRRAARLAEHINMDQETEEWMRQVNDEDERKQQQGQQPEPELEEQHEKEDDAEDSSSSGDGQSPTGEESE